MHSTGARSTRHGRLTRRRARWTATLRRGAARRAEQRRDIVAITAAMACARRAAEFGKRYPDRFFDVGIAEQHAVTFGGGLAMGGLHPVVAIYSTFLNRASTRC